MRRKHLWVGPVALLAVALVGCGDDGGDVESSAGETTTTTEAGLGAEACDAVLVVGDTLTNAPEGPPSPEYLEGELQPAVEAVAATGVEELAGPAEELTAAIESALAGEEETAQEVAFAAYGEMAGVTHTGCGYQTADVTAVDYAFEGLPDSLPAGQTSFALANEGEEEHEIVLFRRNDGETRPIEELLELPEAQVEEAVTFTGATFASPGETSYLSSDLEAGGYVAICFIPVGGAPGGPPHFTRGMVTEFEVA